MCATASHDGDADSESSERTDVLSELSEEDIMDVLSLVTMSSMSGLGPLPIEGEQGTPCSLYCFSDQDESNPR
jgi:hypothetical protein